jgi:endonuclease/exonuclease/phosphatase family metal-dependent hydrolase
MRVVSFNVRYDNPNDAHTWREREALCVRLIRELGPDVLGLQETMQHQVEGVRRALGGYEVVWAGRDDGGAHGESCPVFFRSALFRAVDSGHFWLSNTPAVPGSRSWGTACPRMCTFVVLETRANLRVLVMNTHMDHVSAEASKDLRNCLISPKAHFLFQGRAGRSWWQNVRQHWSGSTGATQWQCWETLTT